MSGELSGKVALVAGGTRGASRAIAVELGRAGAQVYVTGRSSRAGKSEVDRPETIEGTVELIEAAGGKGTAVRVDHLDSAEVAALAARIEAEHGRLDLLVDGIWGGDPQLEWGKPVWAHALDKSLRMIRLAIDAHLITSHHLLPLLIRRPGGLVVELTDGTAEYNAAYRKGTALSYYLAKAAAHPLAAGEAAELAEYGCHAVAFTPGWLRSEAMLDIYGVTEENWREATARQPHFAISETPTFAGRTVAALAADPDRGRWSGQTVSSGQLAAVYGIDDVDGSRPDAWRYVVEVQDTGKPADVTGYR
ncbi:NAD(P)-dependent dehydrogenase (short-subunit alcohol dehydrogenase family) [Amycolatopsis sulphurea]|uniref:NAD(P)-dependent dehydrogenase (Short-subunit alcohol dehydrogenase family) n=1 Tax=Amycolatopsis sulphurea TaxID=76022 RepID=A0A2A9FBJ1_9PSEU|nr:SDR family oxidoreductase [Amycolatopsis sulphurea]PFG48724.1 NAD(P)-dependent dehydrogenase (short-subunit alcohol dehydrogenase family) [Amycolatopsis sulphurea]